MEIQGKLPLYQVDILSNEESKILINRANCVKNDTEGNKSWHKPDNNSGTYMRVIMFDQELADRIWLRIKNLLPEEYDGYKLSHLSHRFRFSKYSEGGSFHIHRDGKNFDFKDGEYYESLFTLNIFLNEDFEGGETDFFEQSRESITLRHSVIPKTGRAALFWADQLHCGNTVTKGFKYLIRSSVMGTL